MKIKRNQIQFSKHYRYLLLTYIIATIVPLLISLFGYLYSYNTIQEDTCLYHNTVLNQGKLTYDKVFSHILFSTKTISRNSEVGSLIEKKEWHAEELFSVVKLNSEFKRLIGEYSNVVSSIGVYFYDNNSFVTNENRYAAPLVPVYLERYNISIETFLHNANRLSGYYLVSNDTEKFIIFYNNIYDQSYREIKALVFAVVPWSGVKDIADVAVLSSKGGTVLINSKDQVIGNSNPGIDISDIHYGLFLSDYDMSSINMENTTYITSSLQSDVTDIRYCIYTPKSVFYKKVNYMKFAIIIELLLSITAGIFVARYFTSMNFGPIERILSLLNMRQDEMKHSSSAHNYEILENTLRGLFNNKTNLEKQIYMKDNRISEKVLSGILKGRHLNEGWSMEYEKSLKNIVDFSRYRIVLFSFEDIENHIFFSEQIEAEEKIYTYSLLLFVIKNVIDEAVLLKNSDSHKKGIAIEIDDMVACIVPLGNDENERDLMDDVKPCINFLRETFQLKLFAAISGIHSNWNDLPVAYEEALISVTHKSFWENEIEDIIVYDNELSQQPMKSNDILLLEQGMKLSNCLATRDYKKASVMLDDIMESCFSKDIGNLRSNQSKAVFIVNLVLNNLENFELENTDMKKGKTSASMFDSLNYPELFFKVKSLRSLKKEICKILDEIVVKYEERIKSEEPEWLQKVKDYVDENYCNPEINISIIADRFNMTLSHMGKVFRKFTGISMLDHIHFLRISKCKSLLTEGNTIKDCAKETGYADSKALIRAFKRYEGITPGQYKTNIGNNGQN